MPGQPKLNVYVSYTDPNGGCIYSYSAFSSLSQTALLTRDLQTKLSVGVWSMSVKSPAEYPAKTEFAALVNIADVFVADFKRANGLR